MRVNSYFGPKRTIYHMQHLTIDLGNQGLKLVIIDRHSIFHKNWLIHEEFSKKRSRSNVFIKMFKLQIYFFLLVMTHITN